MIKGIIFDLDGTLIDTIEDLGNSMNTILENHGYPIHDLSAYYKFVGNGMRVLVERAIPKDANLDILFEEFVNEYESNLTNKTKPYPNIVDLLEKINNLNIPVGVCTNKKEDLMAQILEHYFSNITFVETIGDRFDGQLKPNPTHPSSIAKKMNLKPSEIAFVGDSNVDIQTAINAGMLPVGVSWGFRSEEELIKTGAAKIIHDPLELLDILN